MNDRHRPDKCYLQKAYRLWYLSTDHRIGRWRYHLLTHPPHNDSRSLAIRSCVRLNTPKYNTTQLRRRYEYCNPSRSSRVKCHNNLHMIKYLFKWLDNNTKLTFKELYSKEIVKSVIIDFRLTCLY